MGILETIAEIYREEAFEKGLETSKELLMAEQYLRIENQTKFIIYLINNTTLSEEQIADTVEVPLSFVNQVKESQIK